MKVAVVGAGLAGISCATALSAHAQVDVFEKSRRAGGRLTGRRYGQYEFDNGGQYFTARDDTFTGYVQQWIEEQLVQPWQAWVVDLENGRALSHEDGAVRYIGQPHMDSFVRQEAELCEVQYQTQVVRLERVGQQWQIHTIISAESEAGSEATRSAGRRKQIQGPYNIVILAIPPIQAAALMDKRKKLYQKIKDVQLLPCWSAMIGYDEPQHTGFDAAFVIDPVLSWVSSNNARNNQLQPECWVLHGSPEWSDQHLEAEPQWVMQQMLQAFQRSLNKKLAKPDFTAIKRWRYSLPLNPLRVGSLYDADQQLGICGDWCNGSRIEAAFVSGRHMADQILDQLY